MSMASSSFANYASSGLTLRIHSLALLRLKLLRRRLRSAAEWQNVENGRDVRYCAIVTLLQQPDTAGGTIFVSLGDETASSRRCARTGSARHSGTSF
jgi:error-prone DNA polymerase